MQPVPVPQKPVPRQQPSPVGQWPVSQTHLVTPLIDPQIGVCEVETHVAQFPPLPPQAELVSPAAHAPNESQHPVVQAGQVTVPPQPSACDPHDQPPVVHVSGVHPQMPGAPPPPQVFGDAQSVFTVHPHVPPLSQAVPVVFPTQVAQAPPPTPQAVCAVPGWQLAPLQHPPLQATPVAQVVPHWADMHA